MVGTSPSNSSFKQVSEIPFLQADSRLLETCIRENACDPG
jgi:hypothetical protein